ncbi:MAG: cyclophane-forming radical SAM/SPASM peptide maturase YhhB [Hyphomonadaceae bacterium]
MTPPARITAFLVKLASRCNLDCDYCYIYHHADQSWRALPRFLSLADRKAFAQRLADYVRETKMDRCLIVLHGGEPLLAGTDEIVQFAQLVRQDVGTDAVVDISMQTNGLLLTEDALQALEAADIAVSLSFDGPRSANDLHRNTRKGRSSFDRVMAAYKRLCAYPRIFAGVIAVIDPRTTPDELLEFFNGIEPPRLDFLLPDAHHLRPPPGRAESPTIYIDWLIRAFDLWFDKFPGLPVRTFESLLDVLGGLPSSTDAFGLGDVSLITIETDGTYHDLDVLKVVQEGATRLTGSVQDTSIAAVAASPQLGAHRARLRKEGLCAQCQACPVVDVCGGGSLPHRYGANGYDHPTVYCREWLALIQHVQNRLRDSLTTSPTSSTGASLNIDLRAFEAAEASTEIIDALWVSAKEERTPQFIGALDLLSAGGGQYAPIASKLRELSADALQDLAMLPGSIAWQSAVRNSNGGRQFFAIDGSPLVRDASYLQTLNSRAAGDLRGLFVGADDEWLRAPFGKAIVFENEAVSSACGSLVDEALEIIRAWRPSLHGEMLKICRAIQFIRDPAALPEKIVSFSDNSVPGALYVSVKQGKGFIDPYDLADSLIHEHRHQKLYLLERVAPLVEPTTMTVVSPWREDLRPPSGLLHAVFVFIELRRFWIHVRDCGAPRMKSRAVSQLALTEVHLDDAFRTLNSCPLTDAGRRLVAILDAAREPTSAAVA